MDAKRTKDTGNGALPAGRTFVSIVSFVAMMFSALPAHAELVFFASGRSLSVKGHHVEGDSLVLTLRGGGEIVCEPSVIARIAADEVPYPEPEEPAAIPPAQEVSSQPEPSVLSPYAEIINTAAADQGVDAKLVRAVIQVESAYRASARSPKGAMGLMQLMPDTARRYQVANPYDPKSNIEAGIKHLKSLLERFQLASALAAYNAGEAAVARFRGVPPYPETRDYVSRVLALLR
jgi:soluble lytic murein transglycosylase-like protein